MSSENLSYLGYEDLSDFTSQHSDFASLLVNKEGYIYKFQNFSWIDFILYSGSPNKAALLKLKNGDEVEIKLSVKEVFLNTPINGSEKYFSVRILSDNFVKMASQTDPEISKKSPQTNNFNLSNLIPGEESTSHANIPEVAIQEEIASPAIKEEAPQINLMQELPQAEESSFVLETAAPALQTEPEINLMESTPTQKESSFVLETAPTLQSEPEINLMQSEPQAEESSFILEPIAPSLEAEPAEEVAPIGQQEEIQQNGFKLNFPETPFEETPTAELNFDSSSDQTEEKGELSFLLPKSESTVAATEEMESEKKEENFFLLKNEEEVATESNEPALQLSLPAQEKSVEEEPSSQEENFLSLDFLKADTQVQAEETTQETPAGIEAPSLQIGEQQSTNLNFLKQATQDLSHEESEMQTPTPEAKESIIAQIQQDIEEIDAPTMPQKESVSTIEAESFQVDASLLNQNKSDEKEKSFTKTLQSLFVTPDEESTQQADTSPEATLKKNDEILAPAQTNSSTKPSLGLGEQEEQALLEEFIQESQSNLALFKSFHEGNQQTQANYILVKILSSANSLQLTELIPHIEALKNAQNEEISSHLLTLEQEVSKLALYLEGASV